MNAIKKSNSDFVSYEYKEVTVSRNREPIYTDDYPNFGWALEGTGGH